MPIPAINGLSPFATVDDMKAKINSLVQEMIQLLLNLDSLNITSLTAEKILAGKMIGFVIQTNNDGVYPNVIFSSTSNLMQAFSDANNHIDMTASAGGSPGLAWYVAGALNAYMNSTSAGLLLASLSGAQMTLQASTNLNLTIGSSFTVNGQTGNSGGLTYAKPGGGSGTITFTKGLVTGFT